MTPPLNLSGLAYYVVLVNNSGSTTLGLPSGALNPVGVWRSARCRFFDAYGNVTGYGFTVNPTWQMIETLLRFHIKPQQPPLAGLSNAEKALFNWPAMVAHTAHNATVVASGAPRFCGNFMFAADAKLGGMMETQLRNCRSFKRERGSVISFVGDDARTSVFIASKRAVVPVVSAVEGGSRSTTFTTVGNQPLFSEDNFGYGGSADDADFGGAYRVGLYTDPTTGKQIAPPTANSFVSQGGPNAAMSTAGGYLGTEQSRFKQYAPTCVQHRAAQQQGNRVSPGLPHSPAS